MSHDYASYTGSVLATVRAKLLEKQRDTVARIDIIRAMRATDIAREQHAEKTDRFVAELVALAEFTTALIGQVEAKIAEAEGRAS